jgi:hypothetical protein
VRTLDFKLPEKTFDRVCWAVIGLSLLASLAVTVSFAVKYGQPTGVDWAYHVTHAAGYARGELALLDPDLMRPNNGPYPPLFHLLLAVFEVLGVRYSGGILLQVALHPVMLLSAVYLVGRTAGLRPAAFTAALLAGSVAFIDRAQVIPEALDAILFAFAALAFLENRPRLLALLLALAIWNHGAYALLFAGALGVLALLSGRLLPAVGWGVAAGSPVIGLTLAFLPAQLSYAGTTNTYVEEVIRREPAVLLGNLGIFTSLAWPLALVWLYWAHRHKVLPAAWAALARVAFVWALALLPLLYFFPDRFASYATTPLSILVALLLTRLTELDERVGYAALAGLIAFGLVWNTSMWMELIWSGKVALARP